MEEQPATIIGMIGALLAGPGAQPGHCERRDGNGAIRFTLSQGPDGSLVEGSSRYRGLDGQFSGQIRASATTGVSRYCLEYSDAECCGTTLSFTVDDGSGRILSIEPPETDRRDRIVLPVAADAEAAQLAEDLDYREQHQVGP
ncbi:hypothetical protein [Lichenicoccus roseus]|uniref:hypothetical protein n=1 Tax=Lichenicoccus roseus TaxID=2683649 RepID=UPI00197EDBE9|nr:hypothetical protein [Lichenicoccus roseus]